MARGTPPQNVEKAQDMRDQAELFGGDGGGDTTALGQRFGLQLKEGSDEEEGFGDEDDEGDADGDADGDAAMGGDAEEGEV